MKFSYNWLQEHFEEKLPPVEELSVKLGLHSFELEEVESVEGGDFLIDLDVLPNRSSDCLCYEGMAKEIEIIFGIKRKGNIIPESYETKGAFTTAEHLDFTLNTKLVPCVTKRVVKNIKVGPSPEWLRTHMENTGQNSINNIVDITNYVMFVTGQPVHAFDYDKLAGGEVKNMTIRHAVKDEEVTDLTGEEHKLEESMLVVADSEKALDIAGIKGGNNSGVDEATTNIVVSACVYNFRNIRETSRTLRLATDASKRYENEVPLFKATWAQELCAKLLEEEAGGEAASDYISIEDEQENKEDIVVSVDKINSVLGLELSSEEIAEILNKVFESSLVENREATVPYSRARPDVTIQEDVIEEVGRIYGYYNIEPKAIEDGFSLPKENEIVTARNKTVDTMTSLGFYQTNSRSIVKEGTVTLENPLTQEATGLRTTLLEALTRKAERNLMYAEEPNMFEVGKVFTGLKSGKIEEHWSFAGVLGRKKIKEKQKENLFYETKGVIEKVLDVLSVKEVEWEKETDNEGAVLKISGEVAGKVGINYWEINFEKIVDGIDTTVSYYKPSKFPKMERDVAVFVPSEVTVSEVKKLIENAGLEKCPSVELFDVYKDEENNRKSFAFRVVFQCWSETLTDTFADEQMEKAYSVLKKQQGFEIR